MSKSAINANFDDAIGNSDATDLTKRIATGTVSSLEITEAAIARAESVNPALNAIAFAAYDLARNQASQRASTPHAGGLAGVPTFIKDNTDWAGLPTRHGSRATGKKPATNNSPFTAQMFSTGLIGLGKTTLPEFGLPPTTESQLMGATRNPWNTHHSTGGSSGGSSALVAAGVIPIAHANDGGGSIRIPASVCGLVGLKPSRSRLVDVPDTKNLPFNVVHEGVVTRSVRDTALFMSEAEKHFKHPKLPSLGHVTAPNKTRLRIAVVNEAIGDIAVHSDVQRVLNETATLCEALGHHVEWVALPFTAQISEDFLDYYALLFFAVTRFGKQMFGNDFDKTQVEKFTREFGGRFPRSSWRFPLILKRLRAMSKVTQEQFKHYDVILNPTVATVTPKVGEMIDPARSTRENIASMTHFAPFAALQNITGEPAISLPMGMSESGLPIGMQFAAALGNDAQLLSLAYQLEEAQPWKTL